ncbi:beta-lactamase family protein [Streptomonospora sp. S1-112]|uniref:Beta-lactamase family protein n=1 Tax=Streptomonospora mangrovi TaxID=2883123 RepID=A0A9X3SFG9_9ACTN|nr:serine hydrolase domain-containing protein [Streptomonospora mangrovi]MDA0566848.1 beta-lactamase family protein [Streptomonospora mangrovi]
MSETLHTADGADEQAPLISRRTAVTGVSAAALLGVPAAAGTAAADDTAAEAPTAAGPDRPELQEAVQAVVDAGFAGVQMRVNDARGEWVGSAGVRKLGAAAKPPTNGLFRIASTTKTFVATLVLQLVADGVIGLDDPVAPHLPRFELDGEITVRMLLQHRSGLHNFTGVLGPDGSLVEGIPATGKEWVETRLQTYRPDELVEFALARPSRFAPGEAFEYTNTNYVMAALLVESLTGRPYGEQMRRRILRPLGMADTLVPGARLDIPGPHAHGYYRYQDGGEWKVVDVTRQSPSLLHGAGEMISTTKDLHRFVSALMGGRLLPAPLLAEMRTPDPAIGYGLGLFVEERSTGAGTTTVVHHNGGTPGGFGSVMVSSLDGRTTLTAGVSTGDSDMNPAAAFPAALNGLINAVFGDTGSAG